MSKPQRIVNIAGLALQDGGNGKGFQAKSAAPDRCSGLKRAWLSLTVVPPGKRAWPFHRHHVTDELFYIVSGSGECDWTTSPGGARRRPDRRPAGAEAHQILNTGASELRYLAISDINTVDIIEYPDSGKVGMAAGVKDGNLSSASYKAMGRVTPADYFDGEDTNDKR